MKITLAIVLCLAALAHGRPAGGKGEGEGKNPLVGKVLGFCLRLLEEAVDDPEKRSWDDVFGALAPVCEDLLKMSGPPGGGKDGSGSGAGRPEKPEDGSGSGDEMEKRRGGRGGRGGRGSGSGSGSGDRPDKEDGSGSGEGSGDEAGEKLFWGLYKVCGNLKELFEASQDKRSWEDIFMGLYEVCEAAKEKVEAEKESDIDDDDDDEADLERRGPKGGMGQGGRGKGEGGRGGKGEGGRGGKGGEGEKPDEASGSGSGSGDEFSDEQYRLGYQTVMSLIKLCEGMAALSDQEPPEDADPEWVAIFTQVGDICVATHEQIVADMGEQIGGEEKRMMRGGKGDKGGKGKGGDDGEERGSGGDGERGSGDDGERGSGDRKPEMPENPVEALLDICESLLELEKEVLERRQSKVSVDVVASLMKSVCESAFAQAEEDKKKKR